MGSTTITIRLDGKRLSSLIMPLPSESLSPSLSVGSR